jgi:DNA-binding transcriptional ArsR family regulator
MGDSLCAVVITSGVLSLRSHTEVIVALQGTIETFALPDVMRLLASTKKTGCLRLTGSRGNGSVWVDGGTIVASDASGARHAESPVDVFFELLRFKDGDFVFDADVTADAAGISAEVEPTLDEAERMLDEWKAIEAVVPSLASWVELTPELATDEVTIERARWRLLVAVAAGASVGELGDHLEMGELAISRHVKELVETGLVKVGEAPIGMEFRAAERVAAPLPEPEPAPVFDSVVVEPEELVEETVLVEEGGFDAAPALRLADNGHNGFDTAEGQTLVSGPEPTLPPPPEPEPVAVGSAFEPDPSDAAEIARQLANLSPKAAKAVAAAAKATTEEEREAALAEVDDDEDPINRELLIKFLGSVNS